VEKHGLTPVARIARDDHRGGRAAADHGHRPGAGHANGSCWPGSASSISDFDVIELNEAFAAQAWP
jgi:acetyl-CoA acetyltransferase